MANVPLLGENPEESLIDLSSNVREKLTYKLIDCNCFGIVSLIH